MKKYYNYFLYLSLLGVVYSLYKSDYLLVPEIRNVWHLSLSIVFLSAGILIQCFNWKIALKIFHIKIDSKNAIISHGQSIFMKYVPGKVMSVLGRSMYISREYGLSISKTTSASLIAQLLSLGTGASFALVYIFNDQIPSAYKISIFLFLCLILTFFILFNSIRKAVYSLGLKFKKRIILPKVESIRFITAFPFFYISWLLAGVGFYFFCNSIIPINSVELISALPLSMVLGIVFLLSPGGMGIREGVLVFLLMRMGLSKDIALSIAVFSRLLSLFSELIVFLISISIKSLLRKQENKLS